MALDRIDRTILDVLQRDGRISNLDLAGKVGLSPAPCLRRVRALEDSGIISRYAALLDPARIGMGFEVIVDLRLKGQTREHFERFDKRIVRFPEVLECYLIAGEWDYSLRVAAADLAGYQAFLLDRLMFGDNDIASFRTTIVMKKVKSTTSFDVSRA